MQLRNFFILYLSLFSTLYAEVFSYSFENDAIFKTDKYYTNSISYSWMSNKDTNNNKKYNSFIYNAINKIPFHNNLSNQSVQFNFEHLMFTPEDTQETEKIIDDVPYAGIALLGLSVYRWEEDYFHNIGLNFSLIGPAAFAKESQNGIHKIIGAKSAKGWNNQLDNALGIGITYQYAEKHLKINFKNKHKIEMVNQVRFDLGTGFRDFLIGSNFRYGYNAPNNFASIGKTLGSNQNNSLNLESKKNKYFGYSISYGIFYNYINYFYIIDYDKSYTVDPIRNIRGKILDLGFYYDDYTLSISFKEEVFLSKKNNSQKWGTISIKKVF